MEGYRQGDVNRMECVILDDEASQLDNPKVAETVAGPQEAWSNAR